MHAFSNYSNMYGIYSTEEATTSTCLGTAVVGSGVVVEVRLPPAPTTGGIYY